VVFGQTFFGQRVFGKMAQTRCNWQFTGGSSNFFFYETGEFSTICKVLFRSFQVEFFNFEKLRIYIISLVMNTNFLLNPQKTAPSLHLIHPHLSW
jgi:hypothetical protein